jgi:hypothetical protein
LFLVVWLLNLFLQYLRKRGQSEARREIDPHAPPVRPRTPTPLPPRVMAPRAPPVPAVAPLVASHPRTPSRLGSPREVRRGMVLMTILGPCRALEPPELLR